MNSEEKAMEVIAQHHELTFNKAAQERLMEILINPPEPTEALVDNRIVPYLIVVRNKVVVSLYI